MGLICLPPHCNSNDFGYTPPSVELLNALRKYAKSPIGSKVLRYIISSNSKLVFTLDFYPGYAFTATVSDAGYDQIFYAKTAIAWKRANIKTAPLGSEINTATVDILIAHEVGHTSIGRKLFNLPAIKVTAGIQSANNKKVVFGLNSKAIDWAEIRATRLFENSYRKWVRAPLRRSYFRENDVGE